MKFHARETVWKTGPSGRRVGLSFLYFLKPDVPVFKVKTLFIFSGSCQLRPQGSLFGSCWRLRLCSRTDSCAYRSNGGFHRTGSHSGSRNRSGQAFCGTESSGSSWALWALEFWTPRCQKWRDERPRRWAESTLDLLALLCSLMLLSPHRRDSSPSGNLKPH